MMPTELLEQLSAALIILLELVIIALFSPARLPAELNEHREQSPAK